MGLKPIIRHVFHKSAYEKHPFMLTNYDSYVLAKIEED